MHGYIIVTLKRIYGFIYRAIYRTYGLKNVGTNVILRKGKIIGGEYISIGSEVFVGKEFRMAVLSRNGQEFASSRNDNGKIIIGSNVSIQERFTANSVYEIQIEDDVVIGSNVLITDNNHGMDPTSSIPYKNQDMLSEPVKIGRGCWIGQNVIVLPGTRIGEKSIIGAGSVVTNDIPAYSIAVGNPAKVKKVYDFGRGEWVRV